MIPFENEGECAYIQALPNHAVFRDRLESGRDTALVTAVMVGPIADRPAHGLAVLDWIPAQLLNALSMATGVRVGVPWVEVRDEAGALCSHVHAQFGAKT